MHSLDQAIVDQKEILRRDPRNFGALNLVGAMLLQAQQFEEAEQYLRQALQLNDRSDATLNNYALALKALQRPAEAIRCFDQALAINPRAPDTWVSRGSALTDLGRHEDAVAAYDRAIALAPHYVDAWFNKGNGSMRLSKYDDAIVAYEKAMALKPDIAQVAHALAQAFVARGNVSVWRLDFGAAQRDYDRAIALSPSIKPNIDANRFFAKLSACDWSDFETAEAAAVDAAEHFNNVAGSSICLPSTTPAFQYRVATSFVRQNRPAMAALWRGRTYRHDRIRIAYVSADFREHVMGSLIAGLTEHHDRSCFEVVAVSLGRNDAGPLRRRLEQDFDRFHDVHGRTDLDIAHVMKDDEIDIAIGMDGHTNGSPFGMFACRPAPIAVSYLGFPGTTGAPYFDYIIVDRVVAPAEHQPFYTERLVHLPDSWLVNDEQRVIAERTPTRAEAGLPETGTVFCSFSRGMKITPVMFSVWMRLLHRVDGSVLWLLRDSDTAERNLRDTASQHGIDPARLIFAPRKSLPEHLARHRLADLFLDTLPYNAHTSATDALWAGLPVLSCIGQTFGGRVGASIMAAADLPELISATLDEYEQTAFEIATSPDRLAALKAKVERSRMTSPLFDTARFTRNLEAAYLTMYETHRRGEAPKAFAVGAV